MFEQIKSLGLNPLYAFIISTIIAILIFIIKIFTERKNKIDDIIINIKRDKINKISGFINTIRSLLTSYYHFVKHLSNGDISYKIKVRKWRIQIREEARELSSFIDKDYPYFLDQIYELTDYGEEIASTSHNYINFSRKYDELHKLFYDIDKNLTEF
jgi:hypothetical protein